MADSIEWIASGHRLGEIAQPWNDLLGPGATPFDRPEWFAAWWSAFEDDMQLSACAAWRGDRLVGMLPLQRRSRHERTSLANDHSPLFRPLAADAAALDAVVAAALEHGTGGLVALGVPDGDPSLEALDRTAGGLGMRRLIEPTRTSPIVETAGDPDAWRAQSKPRWRAPLERFRRKMGRDHDARLTIIEPPDDLEVALTEGFAVEGSGWKGERGTAILSSPATEQFYRHIARVFHDRGELRLSSIELDGRLAAFDLTLLHENRLYLIKTGFEERFRALAPGLVMRLSIIERCFELGFDAHELLGDDSEWKRKFSTTARTHSTFRAFPRGALGASRYGYRAVARPRLKLLREGIRGAANRTGARS
jgi:CelD/BcsL family acetyltransferase involved in cellulose biosynthesis